MKISRLLTAVAALTLLAGCDKKDGPEQPGDETPSGDVTPAETDVAVTGVSLNKHETSIFLGGKERLTATVAPENATNKLLTWTSSDEEVAVVNATGLVAALGVGDAVIKVASQADPTKYDECTVHVSVQDTTVHVSSVTITEENIELDLGGTTTATPHVTVLPENATNKALTWSSSDSSKVLVDSATGAIAAVGVTETPVTVTARSVDDPSKSDTVLVSVADTSDHETHVSSITLPASREIDLKNGNTIILTAEVAPSNAGNKNITWTPSKEGVVELTPFGSNSVTVKALGSLETITITATSQDNPAATAVCSLTVKDTTVKATGVSIKINSEEVTEANVELTKNITIEASVLPAEADNKEIVWETSAGAEEFVTLSSKTTGSIIVIGKKATETPVTLTAKAKSDLSKSKSIEVSVVDPTAGAQFVSFGDPVDYGHYKLRIEEDNLNEVEGLSENAAIAKGNYFKYGADAEEKTLYKVGDQGTFRFAPSGNVVLKGDVVPTIIQNIETTKKLYKKGAEGYELVNFDDYASVAANGIDYTFKPAAKDGEFKLELQPSSKYYSKTVKKYEFEFKVIHGYNVDSLAELSLFDNSQSVWNQYKTDSGLGGVVAAGGIILHKDIEILSEILPSEFVESEADLAQFKIDEADDEYAYWKTLFSSEAEADAQFVGSLKDCKAILNRDTKTEDFSFEGNFFSVDCSSLKTIADLSGGFGGDGSHTSLFNINNLDMIDGAVGPKDSSELHDITMRNFTVKANGGLVTLPDDSLSEFEKGGLIAFKMDSARVHVENAIVTQAFTAFMMFDDQDHHLTEFEADRVIGYDSYNSVFYVHGTHANTLSNAWVNKAGGPLVLLDENNSEGSKTYSEANMDCTNCYMHNLVTGTEPWFAGHTGATAMVQGYITTPGSAPTDPSDPANVMAHWYYGAAYQFAQTMSVPATTIAKTMEDGTYCDFVAIDVNARHFADNTSQNLTGHFTLNNGAVTKSANMQMSTVAKDPTNSYACAFPNWSTPAQSYLVSSANGGNMLLNMTTNSAQIGSGPSDLAAYGHFTSDYVNVFLNPAAAGGEMGAYMGRYISIVLGTFPLA